MAYNAGDYQPPQRAYYGQSQQQVPSNGRQQQQYQQDYGCEQATYGQGYGQRPQQHYQRDIRQPQSPQYAESNGYGQQAQGYGNGYEGGYSHPNVGGSRDRQRQQHQQQQQYQQQPRQQNYSQQPQQQQYEQPYPQQHDQRYEQPESRSAYPEQERNYDPRYQQRPGRGAPQGNGQQSNGQQSNGQYHSQRPRPPQPEQIQQRQAPVPQPPQAIPLGDARSVQGQVNGYQQPSSQSQTQQRPNGAPAAASQAHRLNTATAPAAAHTNEQKKKTMDEWKAAEKARLHRDMASPEILSQDNAFPTFPAKLKTERLRPSDRSTNESAMSFRSSEERSRSSLESRHCEQMREQEPQPLSSPQQPTSSRQNSYQNEQHGQLASQGRPSMDHKPYSFEPMARIADQQQPRPTEDRRRPSPPSEQQSYGEAQHVLQQQQYNEVPPRQDMRSPPQAQQYPQALPTHEQRRPPYGQEQRIPSADSRQGGRRPVPAIDTTQTIRPQTHGYMHEQPMSPAQVPPRPSTAQAARPMPPHLQSTTNPQSALSYSQTPTGYNGDQLQPPRTDHSKRETLSHVYAEYHDDPAPPIPEPQSAYPRSDHEIDNEMPDFDSGASGQRSMVDKRKTIDKHLTEAPRTVAPPLMSRNSDQSVQTLPDMRHHQQPQQQRDGYREMRNQHHQYNGVGGGPGFDFGVSQPPIPSQYSQDQPYSPTGHYAQQPFPVQLPQPPYANGQPVRRSMDDGRQMESRQMPYRQGPPGGQRFASQDQPPRGAYPPQQRPGPDERTMSSRSVQSIQTVRSEPGQQRVPSAPPLQQGLRQPPGVASNMGHPLSQQRSAPENNQHRRSNPDALPQHPVPVRPGLKQEAARDQPAKPPPVRNYDTSSVSSQPRRPSIEQPEQPVTHQEIEHLRAAVTANPNDNKTALKLAKRLVEASQTLASEGGRADAKTTQRNREKYILEAHKRVKKAATAGYSEAQFYLADAHGQGLLGLEPDTKEAFNLYQAAAKAGHPAAAYRTAVCCEMGPEEGGGTRKDYAKAVQWYRRAAALGDVAAMYKLGIILLKGLLGQQRNIGDSVTWLKRAADGADKINPHALNELGTLYDSSNTDPEIRAKVLADDTYARTLFTSAAQLGLKTAQFRLGQAYEYGSLNLPIDNRASISWYSKAAAQGDHGAELALSGWYLTGAEGILQQSDTEAYLWARKAAQAEPPMGKALFAMGYFSERGIGCPASVEEGRRWYGRAASYKFPKALERLEELKKSGKARPAPGNGKLTRKDQKRDEAECGVM
ncbi:hypothetical protein LTR62_001729 [Meristemomyces frigidus]|uniref:Uncharacterized protein n=1 Tax=Meristemomyces frigidus TaxID=1508187 RepID=A0AAN7TN19_9PEZI|nr:hypothetical protein LTR62_001729 [Meristemomyces frigidus]